MPLKITNKERNKRGYIAGFISIFLNTALFGLKLWAGIVSGSVALTADAWHTLSDSLSSIIVVIGVKLSSKKPDKEHPFGHGRWEHIASIFIGFLLALIAYDFLKDSIHLYVAEKSANFGALAILVTIISIVVKEGLAQYTFFMARKTGNLSVKADAWHHRTDALSSGVVLIGILFTDQFWWIDSVLGMIISFLLFFIAYQIIKGAISKILGEEPSQELIEKIKSLVASNCIQNVYPHHFHMHNYVHNQELTFHIKVDDKMDVLAAHDIATKIEKVIKRELHIMATIHVEPMGVEHDDD